MKRWMVVLAALLAPQAVAAQQPLGGVFLDWGTVGVAIYPDTVDGLQLHMAASGFAIGSPTHDAGGGYDPDSVFAWVNAAAQVLHPARPPSNPDAVLATPILRSSCGDSLRLFRRAKGTKWGPDFILSFGVARPRQDHFGVKVKTTEANALIDALFRQASLSAIHPDSGMMEKQEAPPDLLPTVQRQGTVFSGPWKRGLVIVDFRIDSTGHPEMDTVLPVYTSSADMIDAAREMVRKTLFTPAMRGGHPVALTVRQAINFGP